MNNKYELDFFQKAVLRNQYKILKLLYPKFDETSGEYQKEKYNSYISALNLDLTPMYSELFELNTDLPLEIQKDVLDVLKLFEIMNSSYHNLNPSDKEAIDSSKLAFKGFGISDTYGENLNQFLLFILNSQNSYIPGKNLINKSMIEEQPSTQMMPVYRKMLGRMKALEARDGHFMPGRILSKEELLFLIDGLIYAFPAGPISIEAPLNG